MVLTHPRETGRKVGRDLSLISAGRSRLAELYDPGITMITGTPPRSARRRRPRCRG